MSGDDKDDGRPIERGFETVLDNFLRPSLPPDFPPEAVAVFRQTFFSGAQRMLDLFRLPVGMTAEQFAPLVERRIFAATLEIDALARDAGAAPPPPGRH